MIPPRTFALNSPLMVGRASSRWRKRAVSSCAVACLSGFSSCGGAVAHPATKAHTIATETARRARCIENLCENHIERLPDFADADQLHAIDGIDLGEIPIRQDTALEAHLSRFANPQLGLADRAHLAP